MQQTFEPRVYYLYVENDFQDDLPQFDSAFSCTVICFFVPSNRFSGYDRIGTQRESTSGVTSRFPERNHWFWEVLLSMSIGQIYFLQDRDVSLGDIPGVDPTVDESPLFVQAR